MDREKIQRQDFPTGRRGYDITAVDEHLRRVADAFESNTPQPAPSLAATTSDQVRQILEAAERSVAEVQARANEEASDHVARVQTATTDMLTKLNHLESELNRLLSGLRASGERLNEGLAELRSQVAGGSPPPAPEAVDAPPSASEVVDSPPAAPAPAEDLAPPANGTTPPAADGASLFDLMPPDDEAGARLIALNMALSGSSREDTAHYLAEHFDLPDLDGLLDDVYARAGQ